jgi:transketolase
VLDAAVRPRGEGAERGGYVLAEATGGPPEAILIATGSEVALALDAQVRLARRGTRTRVVSLPSWELFDAQTADYRESVLPAGIPKVSVEAGRTIGWERYVGASGASIGLDRFGASAPGPVVQREMGFTVEHLVEVVDRVRTPGGGDAR